MTENFTKSIKNIKPQIQDSLWTPKQDKKKTTWNHIIVKLLRTKDGKSLKLPEKKQKDIEKSNN